MPACQKCHRQFKRKFCLNRHERSHHGTEQHQCPRCHNTFARRDNLEKHRPKCRQVERTHAETDTGGTTLPGQERISINNTVQLHLEQAGASNTRSQPIQEHNQLTGSIDTSNEGVVAGPSQLVSHETPQVPSILEDRPSSRAWTDGYCNTDWRVPAATTVSTYLPSTPFPVADIVHVDIRCCVVRPPRSSECRRVVESGPE